MTVDVRARPNRVWAGGNYIAVIILFLISLLFANEPTLIFLNVLRSISLTHAPHLPTPNPNTQIIGHYAMNSPTISF